MDHRSISSMFCLWLLSAIRIVAELLGTLTEFPLVALQSIQKYIRYRRLVNHFKGPTPLPILGNLTLATLYDMPQALSNMNALFDKWRTFQMWIGPVRHIFISRPDDIQAVLGNMKNIHKSHLIKFVEDGMGDGLISSSGNKWRNHRRLIQPSFHPQILDSFVDIFDRHTDDLLQELNKHINGKPFDISELFHHVALTITTEASMGSSPNEISRYDDLIEAMKVSMKLLGHRILSPWLHSKFLYSLSPTGRKAAAARKVMTEVEGEIIHKKRLELQQEMCETDIDDSSFKKQKAAFLTHLLRLQMAGAPLTDEEIMGEMNTMYLASVDAVKAVLDSTFYELSLHKDVQSKIVDELRSLFAHTEGTKVTPNVLREMQYAELVFKELLRTRPPVWFFVRKNVADTTLPSCGLVVPKGAQVLVSVKQVHSDGDTYPNPDVFDPERFTPDQSANRHPYSYIPFAHGPRICIGKQYANLLCKTMIAKIIWNYEILPDPTYKPIYEYTVSASHKNGTWIRLKPRKN